MRSKTAVDRSRSHPALSTVLGLAPVHQTPISSLIDRAVRDKHPETAQNSAPLHPDRDF